MRGPYRNRDKIARREKSDYLAEAPTNAIPCSEEMIAVMIERVKQRKPLSLKEDRAVSLLDNTGFTSEGKLVKSVGYIDLTPQGGGPQMHRPVLEEVKSQIPTILHRKKSLPEMLRYFRAKLHLTRRALHQRCNVPAKSIEAYELGYRNPCQKAILSIASAMGITMEELFMGSADAV